HLYPPPRPIFASGANGKWIRSVAFSPFGTHVASVADDGLVRFWNICDDSTPETVGIANDAICCCFSPFGAVLAIGHKQGIVTLWSAPSNVSSLQHLCRLVLHRHLPWSSLTQLKMPSRIRTYLRYEL
uniref:SOCS box domain-containing protein n=1 Tax=Strigamia maritima TaxID=126957 RepID=T1IJW0_STRMM